jgi:phosphoglycerate dehydrogenase-like enzyme
MINTLVLDEMPQEFWLSLKHEALTDFFTSEESENNYNIEIIIIRTKTILSAQDLMKYPNLKLIIRAGSGFDNVDVEVAFKRNIAVCTTPDANAQAAFEHTVSLIFAMLKGHQQGKGNILSNNWKSNLDFNWEISDLKVLVVGVGRIGTRVGNFLQSFDAEVRGVDPFLSEQDWRDRDIESTSFNSGLIWCNLLTFHCPLYRLTRNYFSSQTLKSIRNRFWLINTARGGILEEQAVETGLSSGKILGLGMDVFREEPPRFKEYFTDSKVFLTPHIGAYTKKARKRLISETIKVWKAFAIDGKIINKINSEFI